MKGIQSNGFLPIIAQAIAEMEEIRGEFSCIDEVNLAELGRRTGLSRSKLRRLKANGFCEKAHGLNGQKKEHILDGYSSVLDTLLRSGVSNSTVCLERLQSIGFSGSQSTVKLRQGGANKVVLKLRADGAGVAIFARERLRKAFTCSFKPFVISLT